MSNVIESLVQELHSRNKMQDLENAPYDMGCHITPNRETRFGKTVIVPATADGPPLSKKEKMI